MTPSRTTPAHAYTPWWLNLAWRLYAPAPRILDPALRRCQRALLPCTSLLVRIAELRGPVHPDGRTGSVVLAGRGSVANPISARFFMAPPERTIVGTVPLWRLPTTLARMGTAADMTVAALDTWSARSALGATYLHLPRGAEQERDVPDPPVAADAFARSVRRWLRSVLAGNMTAEVSRTAADFDAFYHTVYVPFARRRYGESATIQPFYKLRRAFRHGGAIVWAVREGRRLAGCLVLRKDDILRLLVLGTADGDPALEEAGVLYAVYLFVFRYASQEGYRQLDLGQNAPLLSNGVLRHKALWGARLVDNVGATSCYAVRWDRVSGPTGWLLGRHPLIFRHAGGLAGVTAVERDAASSRTALRDLARSIVLPGLRRLFVIVPEGREKYRTVAAGALPLGVDGCELVIATNRDFWGIVSA